MSTKFKRKAMTIDGNLQALIEADKETMTKKDITTKYRIPHNCLSTIIKDREIIEQPGFTRERKVEMS